MTGRQPDLVIFALTLILVVLGILMVFNTSTAAGERIYGSQSAFLVRQAVSAVIGLVFLVGLVFYPYRKLAGHVPLLVFGSLLLLLLVLVPGIGREVNSARRWIALGPLRIQPSEFGKLAVILYLSMILAKKREQQLTDSFRGFIPPLLILLVFFGVIFVEPDFSTAAILLFTGLVVFFVAGIPLGHLLGLILSGLPFVLVLIFSRDYMRARLFTHLDPLADASSQGYQIIQSLISFQNGGFWGKGLGKGVQKMGVLPEAYTDFILPAQAEETGFIGTALVLLLLLALIFRIFRVAGRAGDDFGRLFACGIGSLIGCQTLINAGVVSGLFPATGLPVPFISYGGSSLMMFCIAMGIVLSISRAETASGGVTA